VLGTSQYLFLTFAWKVPASLRNATDEQYQIRGGMVSAQVLYWIPSSSCPSPCDGLVLPPAGTIALEPLYGRGIAGFPHGITIKEPRLVAWKRVLSRPPTRIALVGDAFHTNYGEPRLCDSVYAVWDAKGKPLRLTDATCEPFRIR
jgi:hypothetical protein